MTESRGHSVTWAAVVREVRPLGPHLARVVLDVPRFTTNGLPDESVTLYFPRAGEPAPPPMTPVDGVWGYHGLPDAPIGRNYTVRAWEPGTVTIDFVRHGTGVASAWVEQARPGDGLVLWRQRGWYRPPAGTDWLVLATDLTGLPAAARILTQHGDATPVTIFLDAVSADDQAYLDELAGAAVVDVRIGAGNGVGPGTLLDRIGAYVPPPGVGYVWFAGESGDARRARTLWRQRGLSRDQVTSVGYWRLAAEEWERRYARVRAELDRLYQDCLDAGQTLTEAGERVEAELERRGL